MNAHGANVCFVTTYSNTLMRPAHQAQPCAPGRQPPTARVKRQLVLAGRTASAAPWQAMVRLTLLRLSRHHVALGQNHGQHQRHENALPRPNSQGKACNRAAKRHRSHKPAQQSWLGARPQTAGVRHKVKQQRQEGFVSGANRLVPLTLPAQSTKRPATPDAPATLAR